MNTSRKQRTAIGLVVAAISIGAALVLVRRQRSDAPPGPPLADVYAGIAAALSRQRMVAHVSFETESSDPSGISSKREAWLDVPPDLAREQLTITSVTHATPAATAWASLTICSTATPSLSPPTSPPPPESPCAPSAPPAPTAIDTPTPIPRLNAPVLVTTTIQQNTIYMRGARISVGEDQRPYKGPVDACTGTAKRVMTLVNLCPGLRSNVEARTESGRRFDGSDALAIVTTGDVNGIDSTGDLHATLFIDPSTYLPVAFEENGTDRYALGGRERRFRVTTRYRIDFVPRDSLPVDFFEPASIGYLEPSPIEALGAASAAFPLFWLGSDFAGSAVAPPLALADVRTVDSGRPELGSTVQLTYAQPEDQFAQLLTLSEVSAAYARSDTVVPEWRRQSCARRTEVPVPDARVVLYSRYTSDEPHDAASCREIEAYGYVLELDFGDTFVTVTLAPPPASATAPNPSASEQALRALASEIRRKS
jgi:hypothetical protein